jgi:hypothetical protein
VKAIQSLIPVLEIKRYISGVGRERWVLYDKVERTYLNFRLFFLQSFAIDSTLALHLSTALSYWLVTKSPTLVLDCTNCGVRADADLSVVVAVATVGAMRDGLVDFGEPFVIFTVATMSGDLRSDYR